MAAYTTLLTPTQAFAVTKSDSTILDLVGVYVGTTGDLAVLPFNSASAVTFKAVQGGTTLYLKVTKVMSANTTASNMVGLQA